MAFEIVENLEMPAVVRGPRGSKYPFAQLDVGQAFVIPAGEVPSKGLVSVRAAINGFRASYGKDRKFTPRLLEDGAVGVWRTA